jgi:electron transfer flavoprotein alpha subunit
MSVLLFAEHVNGSFKKPAREAAYYAFETAKLLGTDVAAVVVGAATEAELQILAKVGVSKVYHIQNDQLNTFNDAAYAGAIAAVAKQINAQFVVLSQTYSGRYLAPRLAVKLDAALFSGVTGIVTKGANGYHAKRSAFSLKAIQEVATTREKVVVTVKSNAFSIQDNPVTITAEAFDYTPEASAFNLKAVEVVKASSKVSLTEADVVVSAGRGLKGPENWGMIDELADLLGAATACSKPVADIHWRPHHEHVGQTGIQISPNVYIAVGISGAIQHLAGVSSSKTIIVVNKDAEAPFFKAADYGIVGDAFDVIPHLLTAVKEYKANH